MKQIMAYCELNIKILLKTKVSFIWSVILPAVFLVVNKDGVASVNDLGFWMCYIVTSSYLFGIGLHAMELRQSGLLKTIFSIRNEPVIFFAGCMVTQLMYCIICLGLFSLISLMIFGFSLGAIIFLSLKFMLAALPVAFIGYNITLCQRIYAETASTIFNIMLFALLLAMGVDTPLNRFNPLILLSQSIMSNEVSVLLRYFAFSAVAIAASIPSILKFQATSNERR